MASASPDPIGPMVTDFAAMVRRDLRDPDALGDVLMFGVALSIMIDKTDNEMHLAAMEIRAPYDPREDAEIESLYRAWLSAATLILARIDAAEAEGHTIRYADSFRRCVREAASVLDDDAAFFDSDASAARRDDAIDAHREGRTVEFHELGS